MNYDQVKYNYVSDIKDRLGEIIYQKQFDDAYDGFDEIYTQEHGEPARNFTSVVNFGFECRTEFKKYLAEIGVSVIDNPDENEYDLKQSGLSRLSELEQKLVSNGV